MIERMVGIGAVLCALGAAPPAPAQTRIHTESATKQTGPGSDTKVESETVVGTVKEYAAGKKIRISGPNDRIYSFDLDEAVRVDGAVAIGQMAKVVWTKEGGRERVTVIAPFAVGIGSSTARRMPAGRDMHSTSETTTHQPGPNVRTKTEVVVGTVREYEIGKKIKVVGPKDKDLSFTLDQNATINGGPVAVGQRVRVEYTKGDRGRRVTVLSLPGDKKRG
jgi:hypothetical protein